MCNYKSETERTKVHYSFYDAIICTIKISKGAQIFHLLQLFDKERNVLFKEKIVHDTKYLYINILQIEILSYKVSSRIIIHNITDNMEIFNN